MQFWQIIFIVSCLIIFYNYAGYAILVYAFNSITGRKNKLLSDSSPLPSVSFIVAAFNEEDFIEMKITNSLEQDYTSSLIEYIFVTDGSTDNTNSIISKHPQIQLLYQPERKGKSAAINRAVQAAKNDILIFSDANTMLNKEATLRIIKNYSSEKIGGVSGEKKVVNLTGSSDHVSTGEGLYWKYESTLKKIDSDFYSVVGAAGELFSIRRKLYQPLPHYVILDDFIISLKTAQAGYRVLYEPGAYAMESPSFSVKDEQKRKIRISAGGFQSIAMLGSLLYFWKHARLSFLYISHRLLRWTLTPLCLMLALLSNVILVIQGSHMIFTIVLIAQLIFYAMAITGSVLPRNRFKIVKLPYYFTFMNVSVILGFFRYLRGNQSAVWEKAKRAPATFTTK